MVSNRAFSLIELSIVLVILGLLTGGILTGQSLIRAAELRSVATEFQNFQIAIHAFRSQYFEIPGDMTEATAFWGDDASACADAGVPNGTPGTCNGNGNGILDVAASSGATSERFQFWKHLQLAGLLEGTYSGIAGSGNINHAIIGDNVPVSKLTNAGWGAIDWETQAGQTGIFDGFYGNSLTVAGALTNGFIQTSILTPEEAWNIDTKIDDGMPAIGKVRVRTRNNCTNATSAVADSDNFDSTYLLSNTDTDCALVFPDAL